MGTALGIGALVGQSGQPSVGIAAQPGMEGLAGHAVAERHLGHAHAVQQIDDGAIALGRRCR
jgi:hypothetical protein